MDAPGTVTKRGYAKVNLALAVGPPVPAPSAFAGYHPITSWMASVELFDDVEVMRLAEGAKSEWRIEWAADAPRASPIDWPLERDLAVRAHRLLVEETRRELPVSLVVRKRIPVGGGLGGGSADAAAAMMAIRELFELRITTARLAELSTKLGSDVAFFLDEHVPARGAIVSNLGEVIERVAPVEQPIVLFFPPFGCPTGAVYRAFDGAGEAGGGAGFECRATAVRRMVENAVRAGRISTDELFNDLAAPACRVEPQLQEIVDRLAAELNAHVHVTGSGSTLFALARTDKAGAEMAWRAGEAVPGLVAVATRVV